MITLMKFTILMLIASILKNSNPIKMSIILIFFSILLFTLMTLSKGNVWMPMIFFMLFLGGIMVMFMILSALSPNEKSSKQKITYLTLSAVTLLNFKYSMEFNESSNLMIKAIINSPFWVTSATMLILSYFFCFVSILSKTKNTLRSSMC